MVMFFVWIFLIQPQAAKVMVISKKVKNEWKKQVFMESGIKRQIIPRVMQSFSVIDTRVSVFFTYKMSTMPQVVDECIDRTIELLMAS